MQYNIQQKDSGKKRYATKVQRDGEAFTLLGKKRCATKCIERGFHSAGLTFLHYQTLSSSKTQGWGSAVL